MNKKFNIKDLIETAKKAPRNNQFMGIACFLMVVVLFVFWIVQFFM